MVNSTFLMEDREYRTDIVRAIEERLNYMLERFSRVYIVRLDIRFPLGYVPAGRNDECSEFLRRLKDHYTYHGVVTHYVAVREQNRSDNPHYHIAILFDGSKKDNGWAVLQRAAAIWSRLVGGGAEACVHLCQTFSDSTGIKIEKPRAKSVGLDLQNELAAFHAACRAATTWLIYLAKTTTKGSAPLKTKELFCSRL